MFNYKIFKLFLYTFTCLFELSLNEIISLNSNDWNFRNLNNSIKGRAIVPGNIYEDLANNNFINKNFYYGYSDDKNQWIAEETWIYSKIFYVNSSNVRLIANSLDTVCDISINSKKIYSSNNMFIKINIDLSENILVNQKNLIEIVFYSPTKTANLRSSKHNETYKYPIPPTTLPDIIHGSNNVQFLRKTQASFGWDWGIQLPVVGIIDNIYLQVDPPSFDINSIIIETKMNNEKKWFLDCLVFIDLNSHINKTFKYKVFLNDKELKLKKKNSISLYGIKNEELKFSFQTLLIENQKILPWFPNNFDYLQEDNEYFKPNLYNFKLIFLDVDTNNPIQEYNKKIGFKQIKIIKQDLNKGTSFYFEINNYPFYARGINYIPTTLSLGNLAEQKKTFTSLLNDVKKGKMNMIRIWGGGLYPIDDFYNLADQLGILIWQDFMYACSLYPIGPEYIKETEKEVTYQIKRLQSHPSIAVFSGNNEIEGFISNYYFKELYNPVLEKIYRDDYIFMFESYIRSVVNELTTSIPYVASSPTNDDGFIFNKTSASFKGDIHHYDYGIDCLNDSKYPRARFVSEFGFQSYPSYNTLLKSLDREDLVLPIKPILEHRQHAPNMNKQILSQLDYYFGFGSKDFNYPNSFQKFVYLSQLSQALSVKLEAESYLRDRDESIWIKENENFFLKNNTVNVNMGSLIWQLNDIWEAPTWSSIDFHGNYKILQYFIGKFFNPITTIMNLEKNNLVLNFVNDALTNVKIFYEISIYKSKKGFLEKINEGTIKNMISINKLEIIKKNLNLDYILKKATCEVIESCFLRVKYNYSNKTNENFLFLGKPKNLLLKPVDVQHLIKPSPDMEKTYKIYLNSEKVLLFVYLDWKPNSKISGHFSDNGFNIFEQKQIVTFESKVKYDADYLQKNLIIKYFN